MFIGTYRHNLDPKSRIIMPAKFREELGESFYVTKGLSGCLLAMPAERWEALVECIASRPMPKADALQRFFFAGADEVTPNAQGRFVVQEDLRDYAGIKKEVAIVGAGKQIEIWSGERWNEISSQVSAEDIAQLMQDITF